MLLVRVSVRPSSINGLGVFAEEPIARGTGVWRFTPGFDLELDPSVLDLQPPLQRARLLHYGYVDARLGKYVLCCDDARFLNHSAQPSLIQDLSTERHGVDRAARDIAVGEELTVDYVRTTCVRQRRRLSLRCTRLATAAFGGFRERVNSNVGRLGWLCYSSRSSSSCCALVRARRRAM